MADMTMALLVIGVIVIAVGIAGYMVILLNPAPVSGAPGAATGTGAGSGSDSGQANIFDPTSSDTAGAATLNNPGESPPAFPG